MDHRDFDHRKVPNGWAAWFLVLAAALPATVIICVGWKVLTGSADRPFGLQDRALTGLDLLGNRWSSLWLIPPISTLHLIGLLPLVVLTALVVAERPRALVPIGIGRLAATLVAASTALLGLTGSVGVTAQLLGLLPGLGWGSVTGSRMEALGPAAVVFTTTVLGGAATAVLWPHRGARPHDEAVTNPVADEAAREEAPNDLAGAEEPTEPVAPEFVVEQGTSRPTEASSALPAPSATELDLYRRP